MFRIFSADTNVHKWHHYFEGPHDFALAEVEPAGEELSLDARILQGAEPGLEEPQSFDRTVEKARRDT